MLCGQTRFLPFSHRNKNKNKSEVRFGNRQSQVYFVFFLYKLKICRLTYDRSSRRLVALKKGAGFVSSLKKVKNRSNSEGFWNEVTKCQYGHQKIEEIDNIRYN